MPLGGGYKPAVGAGGGAPGPKGNRGDRGAAGAKGDQGEIGIDGLQGIRGLKGDPGGQGLRGIAGAAGAKGNKGDIGNKGERGNDGVNGVHGIDGTNGHDGTNGAQGKQGIQGSPGGQGAPGQKGESGNDGANGQKGDRGNDGAAGKDGANGKDGDDGTDGINGRNGVNGRNGADGQKGDDGRQGLPGPKGDDGKIGPDSVGTPELKPLSVTQQILADEAVSETKLHHDLVHKLHLDHKLQGKEEAFVAVYTGNQVWTTLQSDHDIMRAVHPIVHQAYANSDLITLQFNQNQDLKGGVYLLHLRLILDNDCSITVLNQNSKHDTVGGSYYYKYTDSTKTNYSNSKSNKAIIGRCTSGDVRMNIEITNNGKDVLCQSESTNTLKDSNGQEYKFKYTNLSFYANTAGKQGVENVIKEHIRLSLATYRNTSSGLKKGSFIRFIREVSS